MLPTISRAPVDVVVVVGGATSNNTRELVKTCGRHCSRVHQVQTEADVRPGWFAGADVIGITAGTSTPDEVIDGVERRIRHFADEMSRDRGGVGVAECAR